jgi:hypothetical protein
MGALTNKLVLVVALLVALLVSEASAAITCEQVGSNLVPFLSYTSGRGTLMPGCCNVASTRSTVWRVPVSIVRWRVGASRALPVPSVVSTWVPSPASRARVVPPCPSPSACPPTATSKLSSPFYSSMHASSYILLYIIFTEYWTQVCLSAWFFALVHAGLPRSAVHLTAYIQDGLGRLP